MACPQGLHACAARGAVGHREKLRLHRMLDHRKTLNPMLNPTLIAPEGAVACPQGLHACAARGAVGHGDQRRGLLAAASTACKTAVNPKSYPKPYPKPLVLLAARELWLARRGSMRVLPEGQSGTGTSGGAQNPKPYAEPYCIPP